MHYNNIYNNNAYYIKAQFANMSTFGEHLDGILQYSDDQ